MELKYSTSRNGVNKFVVFVFYLAVLRVYCYLYGVALAARPPPDY